MPDPAIASETKAPRTPARPEPGATIIPTDEPARAVGARFAGLEGYRGIAALLIVVFHVFQQIDNATPDSFGAEASWGYRALHGLDGFVSLFFVLSAFLLYLPYVRGVVAGGDMPSARAFLVRRAARIVPLYLVAILVVWSSRNWGLLDANWRDLLEHLTFTQVYDDSRIFYTIGPAWSLAIEVQFYVLLAVIGLGLSWLAPRLSRGAGLALATAAPVVLFAGSLAYKLHAWLVLGAAGDDWSVWFGLPAKLDEFALGMLLAVIAAIRTERVGRATALALRLGGLAVLLGALALRPTGAALHAWFHTATAVGFVLILAASVLGADDRWSRALATPALVALGAMSYSLYLWHEPLILLLDGHGLLPGASGFGGLAIDLAIALPLSILVAWLSYHLIERPGNAIRGLIDRRGRARNYYNGD
ncbi:acyltransferase family protein [Demequina salsinemoris]|uniref:acyltransferase family protein n=1 Tax=Demequina salsinemoris TaxID=577470 RepID=UPI00078464A7|nr:acyltransferase [Demequina salsinemoris]